MLLALEGIAGAGKSMLRDRLLRDTAAEGIRASHVGQFSWLSLPSTRTLIGLRAGRPAHSPVAALSAARLDLELHAQHNLVPALAQGPAIADRLILSTVALLMLVQGGSAEDYVSRLAEVTVARPDLTVLLTTPADICHDRLAGRMTAPRFGEAPGTARRLASLYSQAADAWTAATGQPVLCHPCVTADDLESLSVTCLEQLRDAATQPDPN